MQTNNYLLSNLEGGYYMHSNDETAYQGLAILKNHKLYKLIDAIILEGKQEISQVNTTSAKIKTTKGNLKITFKDNKKIELLSESYSGNIIIDLDSREINDYDDQGRIYNVKKQNKNKINVVYTKYENNRLQNKKYELAYDIQSSKEINYEDNWMEKNYPYDKSRGDNGKHFVNRAIQTKIQSKQTITINAIKPELKSSKLKPYFKEKPLETLNSLYLPKENAILAGLPWFYQIWARDELISLAPFIIKKDNKILKKILQRQLNRIDETGLVKNRYPESELGSIDSLGLLSLRIKQSLKQLKFTKAELDSIYNTIKKAVKNVEKTRLVNGLIKNEALETWMDTGSGNSIRDGFRIEIQALHLTIYELLNELEKSINKKQTKYENFQKNIEQNMINENIALDGLNKNFEPDHTSRPNVFLAHYINPNICDDKIWENTFDKVIEKCWLNWGGFSSIEKDNPKFESEHTGMNNLSYHHGDSWFFINNMAAIAMAKVNYSKYEKYIKKILQASLIDMNKHGLKGQCSEISSASHLSSKGSQCQAWSSSTLYELIILLQDFGVKEFNY